MPANSTLGRFSFKKVQKNQTKIHSFIIQGIYARKDAYSSIIWRDGKKVYKSTV